MIPVVSEILLKNGLNLRWGIILTQYMCINDMVDKYKQEILTCQYFFEIIIVRRLPQIIKQG